MSDKLRIFGQVEKLQEQIGRFYEELGALKAAVQELLEENQKLALENERLKAGSRQYVEENRHVPGEAAKYLGQLYEDGFHICNFNYGSMRQGECLFCLQNLQRAN